MATHTTLNGTEAPAPPAQSPPPSPQSTTASPSPPTSTPLKTSPHGQPQSFCIDALLRPNQATSPLSPPSGSSPPSSPTSSPYGPTRILPPSLFPTNPATGTSLYPYPGALLQAASAGTPSPTSNNTGSAAGMPSSLESVLKNGMNMQTVQLEWLARTGMLYHRFPELAGNLYFHLSTSRLHYLLAFVFWHLGCNM